MAMILVVDDERLLCDLLAEVLTAAGHRVVTAYSGEEALMLFQQNRPDVTILDLVLPDIDGVTVLRRLRKMDDTASVIALTGRIDVDVENEVRKLGVADFLRKGLSLEALLRSVSRAVGEPAEEEPEVLARILVVDDDPAIRALLHEFLTREGYRVLTASDGVEALRAVKRTRPHLVLLDLVLPGMDGLEVLRKLSRRAPEVGVIVISGAADHTMIKEAMRLGSFDYCSKPLDMERLGISVRAKLLLMKGPRRP